MSPIKEAIEALELSTTGLGFLLSDPNVPIETTRKAIAQNVAALAALAALRSMPAEPVATIRYERGTPGKENDMPKVVSCNWLPDGVYSVYTTPPPAPVLSDAEIDAITVAQWGDRVVTAAYRAYARAIEQAIGRASRRAK